jgi:hypothetical protein
MNDPTPEPEAPVKRGRLEIRIVMALVLLVLVTGGAYQLVFGSPHRDTRDIDSQNYDPLQPPSTTGASRE